MPPERPDRTAAQRRVARRWPALAAAPTPASGIGGPRPAGVGFASVGFASVGFAGVGFAGVVAAGLVAASLVSASAAFAVETQSNAKDGAATAPASTQASTQASTPESAQASRPIEGPDNAAAVERILARIAAYAKHETRFVEQRYLRFLDEPVESSGRLRYLPPNRLERLTDKPKPEAMILDGDTLSMTRDGKTRSLGISQLPAVGALVGSIRDLLAGDRAAIQRRYRAIAQGDDGNWQLVLLPSDSGLAELVTRIVVAGQGERMATIEILQADGDRSLMTLQAS